MSTREIENFIFQNSVFVFIDGREDEGMVVSRYNITAGKVEYYFIPSTNILAFQATRGPRSTEAYMKLGKAVDISDILDARRIN